MENFIHNTSELSNSTVSGIRDEELDKVYISSLIYMDQLAHIYKDIMYNLEAKKVFLDPHLSLVRFSSIIGTNTTYLSNAINKFFKCNFKTLINKYRIEYCKSLLNAHNSSLSIKEIAKACGFMSVSAFYASFKKETGVSPLQYRILARYKAEGII